MSESDDSYWAKAALKEARGLESAAGEFLDHPALLQQLESIESTLLTAADSVPTLWLLVTKRSALEGHENSGIARDIARCVSPYLDSPEPNVVGAAGKVLGLLGRHAAYYLPQILNALSQAKPAAIPGLTFALAAVDPKHHDSAVALFGLAQSQHEYVLSVALYGLGLAGRDGPGPVRETLRRNLSHGRAQVRQAAVWALAHIRPADQSDIARLRPLTEDRSKYVRRQAFRSIAELQRRLGLPESTIPPALQLARQSVQWLYSHKPSQVNTASDQLADFGLSLVLVLPELEELLKTGNLTAITAAAHAVVQAIWLPIEQNRAEDVPSPPNLVTDPDFARLVRWLIRASEVASDGARVRIRTCLRTAAELAGPAAPWYRQVLQMPTRGS
jgi:hypothetical protein